jgi:hypothetical protein
LNKGISKYTAVYYLTALLLLSSAYLFYLLVRGFDPLFALPWQAIEGLKLPQPLYNSYTTFAHVLGFALLCYALLGARWHYRMPTILFWAGINLLFELWQTQSGTNNSFIKGTFDSGDVVAVVLAVVVFFILTSLIDRKSDPARALPQASPGVFSSLALPVLGLFGVFSIIASSDGYSGYGGSGTYEPVYMSYAELRGPLKIEHDRGLREAGKIYLFNNLLIVSEPNKGIHIYDNTDSTAPVHKAFINLPGNLDIAVRDGYMYADSFIDLVVININDLDNIAVSHRVEAVFPYDPYQAVEGKDRFFSWDESKGVITGTRPRTRVEY